MATTKRPSFVKRQKERARQDKRKRKEERRQQRSTDKDPVDRDDPDFDPDIAHIVPGPQPHPYEDELADEPQEA